MQTEQLPEGFKSPVHPKPIFSLNLSAAEKTLFSFISSYPDFPMHWLQQRNNPNRYEKYRKKDSSFLNYYWHCFLNQCTSTYKSTRSYSRKELEMFAQQFGSLFLRMCLAAKSGKNSTWCNEGFRNIRQERREALAMPVVMSSHCYETVRIYSFHIWELYLELRGKNNKQRAWWALPLLYLVESCSFQDWLFFQDYSILLFSHWKQEEQEKNPIMDFCTLK